MPSFPEQDPESSPAPDAGIGEEALSNPRHPLQVLLARLGNGLLMGLSKLRETVTLGRLFLLFVMAMIVGYLLPVGPLAPFGTFYEWVDANLRDQLTRFQQSGKEGFERWTETRILSGSMLHDAKATWKTGLGADLGHRAPGVESTPDAQSLPIICSGLPGDQDYLSEEEFRKVCNAGGGAAQIPGQ